MIDTTLSILDACCDPSLFGRWFRGGTTWRAWFAFLRVLFALPLDDEAIATFKAATGRDDVPTEPSHEAWLICGRRSGKSLILSIVAVFLAVMRDWSPYLVPGERCTIMVIASDKKQARTIFRYVRALLREVPMLNAMVVRETSEAIDLDNRVTIEILTASWRTTRGYTIAAALLDELAFWRTDEGSANPDSEILAALRPAMATIPGAMLLCASSPYARRGAMWDAYRRYYGKPGTVLVWKAATRTMNPTVPQQIINEAYEADAANASAEYGAEFRTDVETFVTREVIDSLIVAGRYELPPAAGVHYSAFFDGAGGSGGDSAVLAIGHQQRHADSKVLGIVDLVRERRPPFSPSDCIAEFASLCGLYKVRKVRGDKWGGAWPIEAFATQRISYETAELPKSEIYKNVLPSLNSGLVELLDVPKLAAQLCSLERRVVRGGKDSIDHPPSPNSHDDVANAVAGVLHMISQQEHPVAVSPELLRWASQPTSYSAAHWWGKYAARRALPLPDVYPFPWR